MGTTLSIATLLLALLFIAVEAGLGALRGMKKELCRIGSLFVIGLLLFFLVPEIAKGLILAVIGLIYPGGNTFSEIAGMIVMDLQLPAAVVSVIETILALTISLLVPFVFVALFWILKLISWPVFALVCLIIRNVRKPFPGAAEPVPEAAAALEEGTPSVSSMLAPKDTPDLTERLIGAAIGAVAGLFLGALTFMPLSQLSKTVETVGQDMVTELTDSETADIIFFWSESPAGTLYRVTQLDSLFGMLHNSLAKIEIGDKIYEAKSLTELLEIIPEVVALAEGFEDAEIEDLAAAAEPLKSVLGSVLDISLFTEEEKTELIRYLAREGLAETEEENRIVTAALEGLEKMSFAEVRNDVLAAIDLIVVFERYGLTDTDDLEKIADIFCDENFICESADAVYALNLAEQVLPAAIDSLLEAVLAELDVKITPSDRIGNFKETKDDFEALLQLTGDLANPEEQTDSAEGLNKLVQGVLRLKDSPFVSEKTIADLEDVLLDRVFTRGNVRSIVDEVVGEKLEEIRKNSKEEIDDETVEKTKEIVVDYLADNKEVTLDDLNKVMEKMEDGTLVDKIDDADVIEEIKNGSFDLNRWLED